MSQVRVLECVGVRQVCVMSLWLSNIHKDGVSREKKAKVGKVGAKLDI